MKLKTLAAGVVSLVGASLFAATPAHADYRWCEGTVQNVLTSPDGTVLVMPSFRADWIQVCNVSSSWKGIPANICNLWVAYLTTAAASGHSVTIFFGDAPPCNQVQTYGDTPAPGYVNLHIS